MWLQQGIGLEQKQEQRQFITLALRQSLQCLQVPMGELAEYLQEQALSNPLLEIEPPQPEESTVQNQVIVEDSGLDWRNDLPWEDTSPDPLSCCARPDSFTDYLLEQVNCMSQLDETTGRLCRYLIGCLDSTGYLSCALPELAEELDVPLYDLEQALYLLQMLEPIGVGARELTECLLLQLAQRREFNAVNIRMIREGLPLLAKQDYAGLSRLLSVPIREVRRSAEIIRTLNPIPSRGFYSGEPEQSYIIPEAVILRRGQQLVVEMSNHSLPQVHLSQEYCAMLDDPAYREVQGYLKERLSAAKETITQLSSRQTTLFRLLSAVIQRQEGWFLRNEPLRPMTMRDIAGELSLSTPTVSRAVKDKYIQYENRMLPLRFFFSAALQGRGEDTVSTDTARQQLRLFIRAEDSATPLSDEALARALSEVGITISRRTVAKYRAMLGIPPAAVRKRRSQP